MTWTVTRPGEITLNGTPFRIQYVEKPQSSVKNDRFVLYLGTAEINYYTNLANAKYEAEHKYKELVEIGLLP